MKTDATKPKQSKAQTIELKLVTSRGALYQADCLALLSKLKDNIVDCIFADPPFNLGKNYGSSKIKDLLPEEEYVDWTQGWLSECARVLKPGGSLFVYHIPKRLIQISNYLDSLNDMEFRNWIAIKMKNGFPIRNRLHPAHYGLLYYVKSGSPFKFHVVRAPSPICRHCGELIRDYGGYKKKYRTLKENKNVPLIQIADVWDDIAPNIHRKSRPKAVNELPLSIPERAILLSTNKNDLIFDPFVGGGSTLHAAELNDRYWFGSELGSTVYASKRILAETEAVIRTTLPKRLQLIFQKSN
jgi:site-specific DNA-methyltransferase (adenine-specific)